MTAAEERATRYKPTITRCAALGCRRPPALEMSFPPDVAGEDLIPYCAQHAVLVARVYGAVEARAEHSVRV